MFDRRRILTALQEATLAPSIHNSQPWRFRISGDAVSVLLDASVTPRLVDPSGRWALQSIGAVVASLEIALATATGHAVATEYFPDGEAEGSGPTAGGQRWDGRVLAVVRQGGSDAPATEAAARLFPALSQRHTSRSPLLGGAPSDSEWQQVVAASSAGSVRGFQVPQALGERLLELTALADAQRVDDPAYLAEVQKWIDHSGKVGIPHAAAGASDSAGAYPGRNFARSLSGVADWSGKETFEDPPALFVVASSGDSARDQVLGGYGLQRALLEATSLGLGTGVLGQALEEAASHEAVNAAVSSALGEELVVHQILRLGHPDQPLLPAARTPRRKVSELLVS